VNLLLTIITRTTVITALVLVLASGLFIITPKVAQMRRLESQRSELLRKIDHKNSEIKLLKEKQQRFKTDPEFVEHIARQNKRVRAGELVFVFDPDAVK
jgi:low affinity Fe/Cu permease